VVRGILLGATFSVLLGTAVLKILALAGGDYRFAGEDELLRLPRRWILFCAAAGELAAFGFYCAVRSHLCQAALLIAIGVQFVLYHAGLLALGAARVPCGCLGPLTFWLHLPAAAGTRLAQEMATGILLVGSLVFAVEYRRAR